MSNRIPHSNSFRFPIQEERRRDSLLRAAWMRIVQGFTCRPSPRSPWDEAATGDVTPWAGVVVPARNAVARAVYIGNQQLIDETMEGVRDFLRAIEADIASLIPEREEESVTTLAILEAECSGEAAVEEMRMVAHPSPTAAERAIAPLAREISALDRFLECCERMARQPQMRRAI